MLACIMGERLLVNMLICELLGYEILEIGNFPWTTRTVTIVLSLLISEPQKNSTLFHVHGLGAVQ